MSKQEYSLEKIVSVIKELFNNGKTATVTVTGQSMAPMLYNKISRVILAKVNPKDIKKYDILLYKSKNSKYVLHRVIKLNHNTVNCCGDSQIKVERNIKKADALGKVIAFSRKGKFYSCNNIFYKLYCVIWVALRKQRTNIMIINKKLRGKK